MAGSEFLLSLCDPRLIYHLQTIIFDLSKLKGDINCQVKAFEHLLCAMYGEAPRLSAYSKYGVSRHLTLITDLADYCKYIQTHLPLPLSVA